MITNTIYGKKINLRAPNESDDRLIVNWRNNPINKKCFFSDKDITLKSHKKWIKSILNDRNQILWIIETKFFIPIGMTGLIINYNNFFANNARLLIGDINNRGNGFATEAEYLRLKYAFHNLNLNRVSAECIKKNVPIINFLKKIGFKEEGLLKEYIFKDNNFEDIVILAILKKEFNSIYGEKK